VEVVMSIETFLLEIENRKKRDLAKLDKELDEKGTAIQNQRDAQIKEIQERFAIEAKLKSERESARIIESARLEAKKILFDAVNSNLESAFEVIKQEIAKYVKSPHYKKTLETMVNTSKKKLGQNITVHCREEDHAALKEIGVTVGTTIQTSGGIIAENKEGTKELDLTFDELLRTHEDEVKSFLTERT
jgi:V/A-type H+/Na+-transporting ATPase subunit E